MVGSDGNAVTIGTRSLRGRAAPPLLRHLPPRARALRPRPGRAPARGGDPEDNGGAGARLGLADRGLLAPGKVADVTVFDPRMILDHATYEAPARYAAGVRDVLVAGRLVLDGGRLAGVRPGRALARPA